MTWVTWIEIVPETTTDDAVRQIYDRTRSPQTGKPPDSVRLTSLTPRVAGFIYDLRRAIRTQAHGLTRREQEIVALVVSAYNGCVH